MIGQSRARYCSPACKQRAHRSRKGANRNAPRKTVTVSRSRRSAGHGREHCAEAVALLAALDAELAKNSEALGQRLVWSAAEAVILELLADTVDRRAALESLMASTDDAKIRLKVAAELRLIDAALARLLREIKTELPPLRSRTSEKASRAARTRWDRDASR